jgi:hypothetical protein
MISSLVTIGAVTFLSTIIITYPIRKITERLWYGKKEDKLCTHRGVGGGTDEVEGC